MIHIIQILFVVVSIGINALLGIFVYKNNPKSMTNRIFAGLSIITMSWLIVMYISSEAAFINNSLTIIRLSIFFAVPQVVFFFLLAYTIPDIEFKLSKRSSIAIFIATIGIMLLTLTPLVFSGVVISNNSATPIIGPGIPVFSLYVIGFSIAAIYELYIKIKRFSGFKKEQVRFVMYGIITMLGLIISTILIPVALFHNNSFVPFAPLYTLIFLGATAYAIVKHRLLDIRAIVARSVAFTTLILIVTVGYSVVFFTLGSWVFNYETSFASVMISSLSALFIAFSFHPLLARIERFTDRFFFKDKYNASFLLAKLSRIMASTLELKEIARLILKVLINDMKLANGYVVLVKDKEVVLSTGISTKGKLEQDHFEEYITHLMKKAVKMRGRNVLVIDELSEGDAKSIMAEHEMNVAFPLIVDKKPIGIMWFGHKLSGDIYSSEDLHMFEILAPEIAVAVNNSLQFEEIKKFSETLKEEVRQATAKLKTANSKLKELDKMKDDFVSVASHELRTPMTAIKSYLWMTLAGKGGRISKKQKFYLDRAFKSTDRLIKLVNDMLNISRIESGRISIEPAKVDLPALVAEVIDEVTPRANELKLSVKMTFNKSQNQLTKEEMRAVAADSDKIKEVLFNLIGNSLKFTPEKGTVEISFSREKDNIVTHVKDSGRGIDAKDMSTLFTKFGMVKGSYATNKKASGTGLGLFISQSIVKFHGGEITVFSDGIDKGSTFSFSLPMYKKEILKKLRTKDSKKREVKDIIHTGV